MNNTKKIVDYFKVPFAIENPRTALSRYILQEYWKNECDYCAYGFPYKKPTSIYSDTWLALGRCNHKEHTHRLSGSPKKDGKKGLSGNKERSRVPEPLIQDIFKQLMDKELNNE